MFRSCFRRWGSFSALGVQDCLVNALKTAGVEQPSWIQTASISRILQGQNVLIADQTGTGKTLAYLVPVVQSIKMMEQETGLLASTGRPRALIVAPSRELAVQIADIVKMLSHHVKLSSCLLTGGAKMGQQKRLLELPMDLIVTTPGRMRQQVENGSCRLRDLKIVVIDEADTLLDDKCGFKDDLNVLLGKKAKIQSPPQFVLVSASMPKQLVSQLKSNFHDLQLVASPKLHNIPESMKVEFIDIGARDKQQELISIISSLKPLSGRVLVFCNTTDSCRSLDHALRDSGFDDVITSIHSSILPKTRAANFSDFTSGRKPVLVTTDIACRGLDLPSSTSVIIFDFPLNATEFIHRAGRTARSGRHGAVTALVTKRDRVLAKAIEEAISNGCPVNSLSSSKPRPLDKREQRYPPKFRSSSSTSHRVRPKIPIFHGKAQNRITNPIRKINKNAHGSDSKRTSSKLERNSRRKSLLGGHRPSFDRAGYGNGNEPASKKWNSTKKSAPYVYSRVSRNASKPKWNSRSSRDVVKQGSSSLLNAKRSPMMSRVSSVKRKGQKPALASSKNIKTTKGSQEHVRVAKRSVGGKHYRKEARSRDRRQEISRLSPKKKASGSKFNRSYL